MARTWFITGSSRGLGRAITEAVLRSGDKVVATARQPSQLDDLDQTYGSDNLLPLQLDVTNNEEVLATTQAAKDKFGQIDIVVNNAGYANIAAVEDASLDDFRRQFDTNFFGVVNVTKAVLPILREQGHGRILQVSSVGDRMGSPGLASYQSAKWAVAGFSTVLSREVAPLGIKITVLEPGGMSTDWAGSSMGTGPVSEPYKETVGKNAALRQQLRPGWTSAEKVADAILHITNVEDPPLRLLLGKDTVLHAKKVAEDLAADDEKWRHVTELEM